MRKTYKNYFYKLQFIDSTRFMEDHYQILLITLLKEFIKLNANMDMIIENAKHVELNTKLLSAVLNRKSLRMS